MRLAEAHRYEPLLHKLKTMKIPNDHYSQQFDFRRSIPDHPYILTRWKKDSAHTRRTSAALLDLGYGEAAGERLDFFPAHRGDAPLLVFIHGGWWRSLDKSDFSFIAPAYVKAGFNVAVTNYTLAPAASIHEIVLQQLRAIAWLYNHAEQYDFDHKRIIVAGHSAGAHLTAMMLAAVWPTWENSLPPDLIKGAVMMSGIYDLEPILHTEIAATDLKLTEKDVPTLSPAWMPLAHPTPFITATGDWESEEFKRQNKLLATQWKENHLGDIALEDINHMTICDAFAAAGNPLFEACCSMAKNIR